MTHRFNHFDGDNAIVGTVKSTIVIHEQICPIGMARLFDHLSGISMLLFGNCGTRPNGLGGIEKAFSKASPSTSDFQHLLPVLNIKLFDDAVVLSKGCLFQGGFFGGEDTAGISHRRVEHELIKIIAQVVMQGDVPPASFDGVFLPDHISPAGKLVQ